MRARAIRRRARPGSDAGAQPALCRPSVAVLVFLRGRDADSRLRELSAQRSGARPVLGALVAALVSRHGFGPLGFRCLGEWSRELDRRLRAAIAFLQQVDFEIGRILRQVVERKLYREFGFESFERYVPESLDRSARTARRSLQSHHIWFRPSQNAG